VGGGLCVGGLGIGGGGGGGGGGIGMSGACRGDAGFRDGDRVGARIRRWIGSEIWTGETENVSVTLRVLETFVPRPSHKASGHSSQTNYSSVPAPNLQPTTTQGMYNFRFTILINSNNTSNY